jgi:hypothetical protein
MRSKVKPPVAPTNEALLSKQGHYVLGMADIPPHQCITGAGVRDIRDSGVKAMVSNQRNGGFNPAQRIYVYLDVGRKHTQLLKLAKDTKSEMEEAGFVDDPLTRKLKLTEEMCGWEWKV